jgi:hypothetical protein
MDAGEHSANVIGRIPLLHLDFVEEAKTGKLISNPDHGHTQKSEEY